MGELSERERQEITLNELKKLNNKHYISKDDYKKIHEAYERYQFEKRQAIGAFHQRLPEDVADKAKPRQPIEESEHMVSGTMKKDDHIYPDVQATKKSPPTPQEVRDRNITWSLSIAVILLLIGGTALATNTWDIMSNWMKTGMIALVSALFFGLAWMTERVLVIRKTAFAFYVLGGLFLPIVYLSIGFFEQLGTYLSIHGEGRFLYGALGSLLFFPIYLWLAFKLRARLFIWISYVMVTLFAGFVLAWLNLPIDGFYLGIMVFNGLLIIGYRLLRKKDGLMLITKDLPLYIQANLILSTLLMILFYSHDTAYGFNLILTAIIYFAMIYVTNQKYYHFVFSAMLVYGTYQIIEFSMLSHIEPIALAALGFVFLFIPRVINDQYQLATIFRYTSAIVSACAFIFISVQGMIIRMDDPSVLLLIAYVLIALNFTYLTHASDVKKGLFVYLSPFFLMAALFEACRLGQELFGFESLALPMFFGAVLFYSLLGCLLRVSFLKPIQTSSRDVALGVMVICFLVELAQNHWWQSGVMLAMISLVALMMGRYETRSFFKTIHLPTWLHPLTLGFAVTLFYTELDLVTDHFNLGPFEPLALVTASFIVLGIGMVWKYARKERFFSHSFFVAQGFYFIGMLGTFNLLKYDFDLTMRTLIVLGGVVMAYLLYLKTKWGVMPYVMSVVSLLFYITGLMAIHDHYMIESDLFIMLQLPLGAVMLLVAGWLLRTYDKKLRNAYWWVGHVYFPFAFVMSLGYGDIAIWSAVLATVIYACSVRLATQEWKIKTFLYACFTTFWLILLDGFNLLELEHLNHYAWLMTSIVLIVGWLRSSSIWRARMIYYMLPFSLLGALMFTIVRPFDLTLLIITVIYIALILMLLRVMHWDIFKFLPLMLVFKAVLAFTIEQPGTDFALTLIIGVLFISIGVLFYPIVYQKTTEKLPIFDWYTVAGFFALFLLYVSADNLLWQKALPGVLIALSIYVQRRRLPAIQPRWILFAGIAYLLEPYDAWLRFIEIPDLIEAECYVLPWVVLAIFLKKLGGDTYRVAMNYMQWTVLIVVSLILIQDALASNTVYDALIIGTLALASLIGGMISQQKSFFFVGAGVLLLNLFLQTRPFWGALPWWVYLLIAGSVLITVASYNEWHKQKTSQGKETLVSLFNEKIIKRFKTWD